MSERIRDLIAALEEGKKPHLDTLRERLGYDPRHGLAALQREIAEEISTSLGRAATRITDSLARLAGLERQLDEADAQGEASRALELVAAFNTERERAILYLRDLKIQREALGFRRHDELAVHYRVPSAKRR